MLGEESPVFAFDARVAKPHMVKFYSKKTIRYTRCV